MTYFTVGHRPVSMIDNIPRDHSQFWWPIALFFPSNYSYLTQDRSFLLFSDKENDALLEYKEQNEEVDTYLTIYQLDLPEGTEIQKIKSATEEIVTLENGKKVKCLKVAARDIDQFKLVSFATVAEINLPLDEIMPQETSTKKNWFHYWKKKKNDFPENHFASYPLCEFIVVKEDDSFIGKPVTNFLREQASSAYILSPHGLFYLSHLDKNQIIDNNKIIPATPKQLEQLRCIFGCEIDDRNSRILSLKEQLQIADITGNNTFNTSRYSQMIHHKKMFQNLVSSSAIKWLKDQNCSPVALSCIPVACLIAQNKTRIVICAAFLLGIVGGLIAYVYRKEIAKCFQTRNQMDALFKKQKFDLDNTNSLVSPNTYVCDSLNLYEKNGLGISFY